MEFHHNQLEMELSGNCLLNLVKRCLDSVLSHTYNSAERSDSSTKHEDNINNLSSSRKITQYGQLFYCKWYYSTIRKHDSKSLHKQKVHLIIKRTIYYNIKIKLHYFCGCYVVSCPSHLHIVIWLRPKSIIPVSL